MPYTSLSPGDVIPSPEKNPIVLQIHFLPQKGEGEKSVIRSKAHEEDGLAQQTVSVVRLPNSQVECRPILALDRKYNIL